MLTLCVCRVMSNVLIPEILKSLPPCALFCDSNGPGRCKKPRANNCGTPLILFYCTQVTLLHIMIIQTQGYQKNTIYCY